MFFFFSGYLLYLNVDSYTKDVYCVKLKKRTKSLLVPYVFWVAVFFIIMYIIAPHMGALVDHDRSISELTAIQWWKIIWRPVAGQFWFIRDLMICVLFSPFIYYCIRKFGALSIGFLFCIWFMGYGITFNGFSSTSFLFVSLGAYFSINRKSFISDKPLLIGVSGALLYAILVVAELLLERNSGMSEYIHRLGMIIGIIMIIHLSAELLKMNKIRPNKFIAASSFFIFAYHTFPLILLEKVLVRLTHCNSEILAILLFLLAPAIIITLGICLYKMLATYMPRFTGIITGGRLS